MKILIYLGHPAHFYVYRNSIQNWEREGHKVFILIKKKDVLEDLLRAAGMPYFNILEEGRVDSTFGIFVGMLKRTVRLFSFCVRNRPDILTGTSVENSLVGRLLFIPVINVNEDDAAVVSLYAKLSYPLANSILNPCVCCSGRWDKKAIKYHSYHELAYLHPDHFIPEKRIADKYLLSDKPYFLIRLAKLTAYHDNGIRGIEAEIAELENKEDRQAFLKDAGLSEPGVDKLVRAAYKMLNLQTFFTVGEMEIRAWTIKTGMTAPQAAGVIHSDLERGFIRAEVMKYKDFISLGSEHACKEAGKFYIEGKNYIVEDGDILHIRFNV